MLTANKRLSKKGHRQKPGAGTKGEIGMEHFSFVTRSRLSESSPMTVTKALWISHSAWLWNAHFLYPTAVYIGHSSGIILPRTPIFSENEVNSCVIKSYIHWLKREAGGMRVGVGAGLGKWSIWTWWWKEGREAWVQTGHKGSDPPPPQVARASA